MIGEQELGGVLVSELFGAYGTPLLVIDTNNLDANIACFTQAASHFEIDVAYAAKALLFKALARRLAQTALKIDVCSLGELITAEQAGFTPERIVLHGCGKTPEELAAASAGRVGRIVIDHRDELDELGKVADPNQPVSVLLRLNTGIVAQTHAYIRTGGEDSKFGFGALEFGHAIDALAAFPGLRLVGIHSHIGSQIFETSAFAANLKAVLDIYARTLAQGLPLSELVIGGGFGVDAVTGKIGIDIPTALRELALLLERECSLRTIPKPRLGIEPGRAIIATSGTSLYRVVTVKRQGARRFAIIDGGIADNPRPALYGAFHQPTLVSRHSSAPLVETTVCGRSCENDQLAITPMPEDLRSGDLVSFGTTGAYTFSMASNYNRFPRPAVVFAGNGHRLVVRRETIADLLERDLDV